MTSNLNGQQPYVPWSVYMQDKREQTEAARRLEGKVDRLNETVHQIAVRLAADDAVDAARARAEAEARQAREAFAGRVWDVAKQGWIWVVGVLIYWLAGGPKP